LRVSVYYVIIDLFLRHFSIVKKKNHHVIDLNETILQTFNSKCSFIFYNGNV